MINLNLQGHSSPYLRAGGILDGGVGALWCPGDALHHMLMLPQLSLALFGSHNPHTHRLVIGATGNQCAILVGPYHTDPLPVACERLHTVADIQKTVKESCSRVDVIKQHIMLKEHRGFKVGPYPVATSHIFMVLSLEAETM